MARYKTNVSFDRIYKLHNNETKHITMLHIRYNILLMILIELAAKAGSGRLIFTKVFISPHNFGNYTTSF